jgi:hypothetical protein
MAMSIFYFFLKIEEIKLAPVVINMDKNTPLISLSWENINVYTQGKKARNFPICGREAIEPKHIVKNGT